MVNIPSQPAIITVNSEALQSQIRDLLPSQNGFGSELQASNVITPIIDLTASAEGSGLRQDLQSALAFGSQTAFFVAGSAATLTTAAGWYRVTGTGTVSGLNKEAKITMTDGATIKVVWALNTADTNTFSEGYDLVFAVATGITLAVSASSACTMGGSVRQIADAAGGFVQPVGLPL